MWKWNTDRAMTALRLVVGLVVLEQSCVFVFGTKSAAAFAGRGLPDVFRLVLGWAEIVAAVLFLVPRTVVAGARVLVAVFAAAAAIHVLHREFDVGVLAVYAAAVLAVSAYARARNAAPTRRGAVS